MPVYVALGDSISIDDYAGGPGRGGASLLARNLDEDFPRWRGHDLSTRWPDLRFHLLATDGATSDTLVVTQLPRLERLQVVPDVVTLTIGGNDVVSRYGETEAALDAVAAVVARVDDALGRLVRLGADPPSTVVGTVYDPSDGTGDGSRVGLPPWPEVVEVLGELNAGLRQAVSRRGARLADIHARFLGHGLAAGNPGQPEARPADRSLWYCGVIEPNAWGASEVRAAFWEALGLEIPTGPASSVTT